MLRRSWWVVLTLAVACGGGEEGAPDPEAESPGLSTGDTQASSVSEGVSPSAPHPDTPEEVVVALIEAFRAGDQARVEALWARDGGTWTDAAGFRKRAAYYKDSEFDLASGSIATTDRQGPHQVVVKAKQDGQDYVWVFLVTEIDGTLRAGGVEVRPAGMP